MVYVTKFRANDLNPSKGKQIEFNAGVVQSFFGFTAEECTIAIRCRSLADEEFEKDITATLKYSPARGDYKIYQNNDGSADLKDVFLSLLRLTAQYNLNDYYAIKKKTDAEYELYYIPRDLLFSSFFPAIAGDQILYHDQIHEEEDAVSEISKDELIQFILEFVDGTDKAGLKYTNELASRFVCAQLTKHFVVLTGLSGSGKTKLAQAFSEWIGVKGTRMLVPVGADWTNSEKLLGYPDALQPGKYVMPDTGVLKLLLDARDNPKLPFFLILDEMNLSHVERYFADFLSAMESGEDIKLHGGKEDFEGTDGTMIPPVLKFPKNLFVIGTMNVDETTYMFSPKVLDRAQVIEFRVCKDEMAGFLDAPTTPNLDAIAGKGAKYAEAFLKLKDNPPALDEDGKSESKDAINVALKKFFEPLADLGAEFGYRTAGEVIRFCRYYLAAGAAIDDAIDAAIVQKLLPKLHGSQQRLGPVLRELKKLASTTAMQQEGDGEPKKVELPLYKLTCEKLDRMLVRLKANGFTSFAEA